MLKSIKSLCFGLHNRPLYLSNNWDGGCVRRKEKEYVVILDFIGNYNNNFMIPVALSETTTYNADVIRKYVISGNSTIPGASTIHFDEIAKEKIFHAIDCIKPSTLKELMKEGYVNLKTVSEDVQLLDFYENAEMDPLVIIMNTKLIILLQNKWRKMSSCFGLSEQEKTITEYLSKETILSGVRPDEWRLLRLFLEKIKLHILKLLIAARAIWL